MNKCFIRLVFAMAILWWPVNIMGETKHCGTNKLPYDHSKEGCCLHEDGTGEITGDPENANMDDYAKTKKLCKARGYGVTFCYNGEKKSAVCPYGKSMISEEYQQCIRDHEKGHVDYQFTSCECNDYKVHYDPPAGNEDDSECEALAATYRCLFDGTHDQSDVDWIVLHRDAEYLYKEHKCTFAKGV